MNDTARAAASTVGSLFEARAKVHPDRIAVVDDGRLVTYGELSRRSGTLAATLAERGVRKGDRVAILSENRHEYLETFLAASRLGAIVACQNWRLAPPELAHCLDLVTPKLLLASRRHAARLAERPEPVLLLGPPRAPTVAPAAADVDPEDPFLILYTSGTTGLPKGAVLSHRAEIARAAVLRAEFGIAPEDSYVAWSPMYHMGGAEYSLTTLMGGGTVFVVDGFDAERLAQLVESQRIGWLLLMPGMVGRFADLLESRNWGVRGVRVCGVMADLVPPADLARITTLLQAPYANTFGSTETGCPPCSSSLVPIGVAPTRLPKTQSPFCEVRLVDSEDRDVPDGTPGEICVRGPTLFSGYWKDVEARDFRGGWFHMGDVFVRNADGTLDFVDRVKYLVKTGGENVYPAEIERVILADPRVVEAAVVRKKDEKWGEVPIAFVARRDDTLEEKDILARCRAELAGYKQPKAIRFLAFDAFPRSASGKVQRHELERLLDQDEGGTT